MLVKLPWGDYVDAELVMYVSVVELGSQFAVSVGLDERVESRSPPTDSLELAREVQEEAVRALGHDPGVEQVVAWLDAGAPGLDRAAFVALGPRGMFAELRRAIAEGEWKRVARGGTE